MAIKVTTENDLYSARYIAASHQMAESDVVRIAARLGVEARRSDTALYFDANAVGRITRAIATTAVRHARHLHV